MTHAQVDVRRTQPVPRGSCCDHCGEDFREGDHRAEVINPENGSRLIVHAEPCFAAGGYYMA